MFCFEPVRLGYNREIKGIQQFLSSISNSLVTAKSSAFAFDGKLSQVNSADLALEF